MANITQEDIADIRAIAMQDRTFAQTVRKERELTKKINDADNGLNDLDVATLETMTDERRELRGEIRTRLAESRA